MVEMWVSYCTEYELGWGSRPDGLLLAQDKESINKEIEKMNKLGSRKIYSRFDEPVKVFCDDETFEKICSQFKNNIRHFGDNNLKKIGNFYKEV